MVLNKVALTGASGMVGRHVIEVFTERNITCAATSRTRPLFLPDRSSWSAWDISEWKTTRELDAIFPDVQAILHVGAYVPKQKDGYTDFETLFNVNVRSCLCLAEWAAQRNIPLAYISSATVYADTEKADIRESDEKMQGGFGGFYGYSKRLAEDILQYFVKVNGLKLCILRPSSIYGYGLPEDKMMIRYLMISNDGGTIRLQPPIDDKVNLIHCLDIAKAMVQALEKEAWGVFNVADEVSHSILEIANTCVQVTGKGRVEVLKTEEEKKVKSISRFDLNCDAARKAFGFMPSVKLEDGIGKTWHDIKSR